MLTTRILLPSCSIPFIDPGGSSDTEQTLMRVPKGPLPVLVVSLEQIRGDAFFFRFFFEFRELFWAWRNLSSPSQPLLFDEVLYRGSHRSERYALDGGV